jgi:hypothetical protein
MGGMGESWATMTEYNELVVSELEDLSVKIVALLKQEDSHNARGVAAMLLHSASMLDKPGCATEEVRVTSQCLDLLTAQPGAVAMLLGQLAKALAFQHMNIVAKKESA